MGDDRWDGMEFKPTLVEIHRGTQDCSYVDGRRDLKVRDRKDTRVDAYRDVLKQMGAHAANKQVNRDPRLKEQLPSMWLA